MAGNLYILFFLTKCDPWALDSGNFCPNDDRVGPIINSDNINSVDFCVAGRFDLNSDNIKACSNNTKQWLKQWLKGMFKQY